MHLEEFSTQSVLDTRQLVTSRYDSSHQQADPSTVVPDHGMSVLCIKGHWQAPRPASSLGSQGGAVSRGCGHLRINQLCPHFCLFPEVYLSKTLHIPAYGLNDFVTLKVVR